MDTVKKYQGIVVDVLKDLSERHYAYPATVEKQLIADLERNRFQVISFGWENEENLVSATLIYIEIKGGKVWIQQNWTETAIATELTKRGIPPSDIVLGFIPANMRDETAYAVA